MEFEQHHLPCNYYLGVQVAFAWVRSRLQVGAEIGGQVYSCLGASIRNKGMVGCNNVVLLLLQTNALRNLIALLNTNSLKLSL